MLAKPVSPYLVATRILIVLQAARLHQLLEFVFPISIFKPPTRTGCKKQRVNPVLVDLIGSPILCIYTRSVLCLVSRSPCDSLFSKKSRQSIEFLKPDIKAPLSCSPYKYQERQISLCELPTQTLLQDTRQESQSKPWN